MTNESGNSFLMLESGFKVFLLEVLKPPFVQKESNAPSKVRGLPSLSEYMQSEWLGLCFGLAISFVSGQMLMSVIAAAKSGSQRKQAFVYWLTYVISWQ